MSGKSGLGTKVENKVKILIYLSLGKEGTNIFHQRNPHTELSKCTTEALVIQLQDTFKKIRNETFNRFQFFRCTQNPGESLEQFHSRINQKSALCNWEDLEDSLVKIIFIQGMSNPQIQMDLLSEDRDPLETLHYAITRERGQENQQRISNTHAQSPSGSGINLIQRQRQQTERRSILPTLSNNKRIPDCWKCGYKFIKGHLDNCPAKNTICNACKKIGHYADLKCHYADLKCKSADLKCHQEDRKYKIRKETTKHTTKNANNKTIHNNKQTQDESGMYNQFLTMSQSKRKKKKKRQKQSTPRAHATSEK